MAIATIGTFARLHVRPGVTRERAISIARREVRAEDLRVTDVVSCVEQMGSGGWICELQVEPRKPAGRRYI